MSLNKKYNGQQIDTTIKNFNSSLISLMKYIDKLSADEEIREIRKNSARALSINDTIGIKNVGPILFKYKEKILAGDIQYFLNEDFKEYEEFGALIKKVKELWNTCKEDDQEIIVNNVTVLTTLYINYVLLEKRKASL